MLGKFILVGGLGLMLSACVVIQEQVYVPEEPYNEPVDVCIAKDVRGYAWEGQGRYACDHAMLKCKEASSWPRTCGVGEALRPRPHPVPHGRRCVAVDYSGRKWVVSAPDACRKALNNCKARSAKPRTCGIGKALPYRPHHPKPKPHHPKPKPHHPKPAASCQVRNPLFAKKVWKARGKHACKEAKASCERFSRHPKTGKMRGVCRVV